MSNLLLSVLLAATTLTSFAPRAQAAMDTPAEKKCLYKALAVRSAAIANGTPRSVADKAWAKAVAACKGR